MSPPLPSLTKEWRQDTYPAISPSRPELSAKGKVVVITGAGAGIGREIAKAFATAEAKHIALISRTEHKLVSLKGEIEASHADTQTSIHTADVSDEAAMTSVAAEIGPWDVLIINAGLMNRENALQESKTNVKGTAVTAQSFMPRHNPGAAIIGINAAMINLPATSPFAAGNSSYVASKMAQVKVMEYIAAENPDIFIASVHPGVVDTDLLNGLNLIETLPKEFMDTDVDELKARAKEIQENEQFLQANILGWPFQAS
ncbi:MAG: hypothetical protein Q9170_000593 [Blastenia crenularia]